MLSLLGQNNLPRGLRNNNPGNLILTGINWQGKVPNSQNTDGTFEQYTFMQYGIRAMALDIIGDVEANGYTLAQLINEYSPPSENNTQAYITQLSQATGVQPNAPLLLTTDTLPPLLYAMMKIENGAQAVQQYVPYSIVSESIQLLPAAVLNDLQQFVTTNPKTSGALVLATLAGISYVGYRYYKKRAA